jgi:hypothetical protein
MVGDHLLYFGLEVRSSPAIPGTMPALLPAPQRAAGLAHIRRDNVGPQSPPIIELMDMMTANVARFGGREMVTTQTPSQTPARIFLSLINQARDLIRPHRGADSAEVVRTAARGRCPAAGGERRICALETNWDGVEAEAVEGLADEQAGFGEMALEAPAAAVGDLVLGARREQVCEAEARFLFWQVRWIRAIWSYFQPSPPW